MTLIYWSSCAIHPNGQNDPFMVMEQPWLVKHFSEVMMAAYQGADWLTEDTTAVHTPKKPLLCSARGFFRALVSADVRCEWKRLKMEGRARPVELLKVLLFAARGQKMLLAADALMRKRSSEEPVILYSCWMSFDAYAAALMKRKYPGMKLVVRGHAFDIDTERNPLNPYLMKQAIADAADGLYLICDMAKQQYMSYMQGRIPAEKVHVLPFGSAGEAPEQLLPPPLHTEGVLRIVSCAKVIPIKQVHVLLEALAGWDGCPVYWQHIGDGEGMEALRLRAEELLDRKENVIVDWRGGLSASQVLAEYENKPFDVFINTSKKEGAPVSIMEAMRCGVPVIAPNVGGIPEVVNCENGWLYEPEEGSQGVVRCLRALVSETAGEAEERRRAAAACWKNRYRNSTTLEKLFSCHAEQAEEETRK